MIDITIPGMRLVSEANSHTHWRQRQKRAKQQRTDACWQVMAAIKPRTTRITLDSGCTVTWARETIPRPPLWRVTITRISPRPLDSDNLVGSAKHVRDGVADALGINDRDERVQWVVAQAKSASGYAVRIQIEAQNQEPEPVSGLRGKALGSG